MRCMKIITYSFSHFIITVSFVSIIHACMKTKATNATMYMYVMQLAIIIVSVITVIT